CTVIESRVTLLAPPENAVARLRPPSSTAPDWPQKVSPDFGRTLKLFWWIPALTTKVVPAGRASTICCALSAVPITTAPLVGHRSAGCGDVAVGGGVEGRTVVVVGATGVVGAAVVGRTVEAAVVGATE